MKALVKSMALGLLLDRIRFQPWNWGPDWLPKLQAHRGFCVDGDRENTLASLAAAHKNQFEMVEIDVRLSKDGIPVLGHDEKLDRLVGLDKMFADLTAEELGKLDFPTLEEVLKTKNRPGKINIEIKNEGFRDFSLERKVIEVIRSTKKQKDVLISAFNPLSLAPFVRQMPEVPRALLIESDKIKQLSYLRLAGIMVAQPHMINWPHQLLNRRLVQFLKFINVPVAVWTVNDYRKAKELYSWGVDSIISDRITPDKMNA